MVHRKSLLLTISAFFCAASVLFAQTGSIKGNVKDLKTGEALIGATVSIQGTTTGAITDVEGSFLLPKVAVGKQVIVMSYVSYKAKSLEVDVESGKQIVINTAMEEDAGTELQEVVVTASRATNTEVAVISEIKSIQQVAVGISSQQIAKSQDRDAAQVARRVPGVSIIDNRFVLIRGLGQRYNTVMINNVIAPSTEIDTRAFSFDMVPSGIIDRMLIYKSGAAELPGEFAGGVIKIFTKRAPEENFVTVGVSTGYRIGTTFQDIQRQTNGSLTFLGFNDSKRNIPGSIPGDVNTFNNASAQTRAGYANQLGNRWGVNSVSAPLDIRANLSFGKRFDIGNVQVGTLTGINYASYNQDADVEFNTYLNDVSKNFATQFRDKTFTYNARLGVMHNWSFRFNPNFTIEFKNLFNQLGFAETVVRNGKNFDSGNEVQAYSQRFENRSIYSGQLLGKHTLGEGKTDLDWVLGYSYVRRTEPDWRRLTYNRTNATQLFSAQTDGLLQNSARFNSNLNESVYTAAANSEFRLGEGEDPAKIKAGFYTERKDRNFVARWFGYTGGDANRRFLPINTIFSPVNVTGSSNESFTVVDGTQQNDRYTADNTLLAGYVSGYFPITEKLSATAGFRLEYNLQQLRSKPNPSTGSTTDIRVSNGIASPLPSLNITYDVSDKQLVRLAYAYTINRPELRELAPFQYFDFNFNANVEGNEKLKVTRIQNLDARWEYYPSPSELISIGGFYKYFTNPIENFLPQRNTPSVLDYTFINAKNAYSYGVEAEVRKSFYELSSNPFLKNITLLANASYIVSRIDLGETVTLPSSITDDPYDVTSITEVRRPMMNQSPYLINLGAYYNDEEKGWQANVLYNVFGKRIFAVGNVLAPTIYEMPRNVLDITVSKTFAKKWEIRAAVQDILNQPIRLEQDFNRDSEINSSDSQTIRNFRRGAYVTLGLNYTF